MPPIRLHKTVGVKVGSVQVGGGAPVAVQSMTNTDTPDVETTARQCIELAQAGSEMVRITVNLPEAAAAVPAIKQRMLDAGVTAPLIGDFHYNGHILLTKYPDCARALDKYRINPGNVGTGKRRDEQFTTICMVAADNRKPVRIGVNGGSLEKDLLKKYGSATPEAMVESGMRHVRILEDLGFSDIVISLKASDVNRMVAAYRLMAEKVDYPLHLGVTEAGTPFGGTIKSAMGLGILLHEGIGDTIRVSLAAEPHEEVRVGWEILKSLELRKRGVTVVVVEHNMELVMNVADRILVMDYGQHLFEGVPADVQKNEAVVSAYLGGELM